MLGKNNKEGIQRQTANKVNRYGIRRLSMGVASVAVAGLLFMSNSVLADELSNAGAGVSESGLETSGPELGEGDVTEPTTAADAEPTVEPGASDAVESDSVDVPQEDDTTADTPEETLSEETPKPEAKEAFKFTTEQRAQLKAANFTEAEINALEAEIAANHDATYDASGRISDAIAAREVANSSGSSNQVSEPLFSTYAAPETDEGDNLEVTPEDKPDNQNAGNENVGDKIITTFSVPETDQKGNSEENNELDDTSDQLKFSEE
ncbi:MAG: YSIRK-type signal peptide-containing protein, partial [Clostridium celatum]|nr:YSIRK-type signal peptide-containing protein [Clostridium celatum]